MSSELFKEGDCAIYDSPIDVNLAWQLVSAWRAALTKGGYDSSNPLMVSAMALTQILGFVDENYHFINGVLPMELADRVLSNDVHDPRFMRHFVDKQGFVVLSGPKGPLEHRFAKDIKI